MVSLRKTAEPLGLLKDCKYFPCHKNLEDCTFCFCPLYPCLDEGLGKWIRGSKGKTVWSCKECTKVHEKAVVKKMLKDKKILERLR